MRPTGHVKEGSGAGWGMKFYRWQGPFRFEYLVLEAQKHDAVPVFSAVISTRPPGRPKLPAWRHFTRGRTTSR